MPISLQTLEDVAVNLSDFAKLSNIGEIGMAPDFSDNTLANELQNRFPFLDRVMNTSASRMVQSSLDNGTAYIFKNEEGNFALKLPYLVGTTLPEDTSEECCWTPLELAKCGSDVEMFLLCLKDCENIMDVLVYDKKRFQSHDLIGYFIREGETVNQARTRMALLSMAYLSAVNFYNGTPTAGTATLKKFNGMISVMENPAVISLAGSNILAAFDSLACRLSLATRSDSDIFFGCHPLVKRALDEVVTPSKYNNELPNGWTRNGQRLYFLGHEIIEDKYLPIDMDGSKGDIWMVDGSAFGVFMGTDLAPATDFRRHTFDSNNTPASGCASECDYYYNFGASFTLDPNRLAVIANVPLATSCSGSALDGLDSLITPSTIVPIDVKTA